MEEDTQKFANVVVPNNLEEDLQFNHPSSTIEGLVNGNHEIFNVSEFASLSSKVFENREDLVSNVSKGQFFKSMGLPCVHMIKEMNSAVLPLIQVHMQWRIDTTSFSIDKYESLDHEATLTSLLSELKEKYEKQPLMQKENTIRQLSHILGAPCPLLFEPIIQPHKGRPVGSIKRKTSSTRRESSHFEIIEKIPRKCSGCGKTGHYRNKCPSINKSTAPNMGNA